MALPRLVTEAQRRRTQAKCGADGSYEVEGRGGLMAVSPGFTWLGLSVHPAGLRTRPCRGTNSAGWRWLVPRACPAGGS